MPSSTMLSHPIARRQGPEVREKVVDMLAANATPSLIAGAPRSSRNILISAKDVCNMRAAERVKANEGKSATRALLSYLQNGDWVSHYDTVTG